MQTTIFQARKILTMNPSRPVATHVAVRDGRILGVGPLEELTGWGPYTLDDRLAAKVLMPGLVEGHSHLMEGAFWRFVFCGCFDRRDPDGRLWHGAKTLDAVLLRLNEAQAALPDAAAPLAGWGFDPIYFDNRRCVREDLDRVSTTRPVGMIHASAHIINCNSAALAAIGWLRPGIDHPGVPLGADGLPTGELKGPEAMMQVAAALGMDRAVLAGDEAALRAFSRLCVRAGVTTATDLASPLPDAAVQMMLRVTAQDGFPTRIVPLLRLQGTPAEAVERAAALRDLSTDRLRLGRIKMVADGSIQGFSARLRWPGYYNGAPNGLWYMAPEQMRQALALALQRGVQIHTHTNGDEATELLLELMEQALCERRTPDHRFTLQHCQLADAAQYRRMKALGLCVNLFANHHFYWGDEHHRLTVGPERATRMNACATALASGVPFAIHSDAPITPLAPLFTAWCAVHRLTASGRVLGEHERIGVADALRAITLGAAYTLKLDGEVGSIECGKRADFCVLDDDPLAVPSLLLKDLPVWGVVQDGRVFAAADLSPLEMRPPIPVTLVGGWLGAGKTTLVNHLLRQRGERRIAVLVNDFGDLAIDADLIESRDGTLLTLAGGCVCCSFGSDLMAGLQQMLALQPQPQHILIETSGVALPGAVARLLGLLQGLQLDAVLVLADAETLRERAADAYVGELVRQQLQDADLLLLNKTDLVADGTLDALGAWLAVAAPRSRLLRCRQAQLPPELLLGIGPMDPRPRPRQPPAAAAAGALFDSLSLEFDHAVDVAALSAMLLAPPLRLLRAKGLMRDRDGQPRSLQLVGARAALALSNHPQPQHGRLVCIAARGELQAERLRAALAACAA